MGWKRIIRTKTTPRSSQIRLQQIGELHRLGVPVQVALDPLVPGLTDTRENLASAEINLPDDAVASLNGIGGASPG